MRRFHCSALAPALGFLLLALAGCALDRPGGPPHVEVQVRAIGDAVQVTYTVRNFRLGRDGHIHLSLDGGPEVMAGAGGYTFRRVAPGTHTVRVWITDNQHRQISAEKSLVFQVP